MEQNPKTTMLLKDLTLLVHKHLEELFLFTALFFSSDSTSFFLKKKGFKKRETKLILLVWLCYIGITLWH